jgi:ERF superfamily
MGAALTYARRYALFTLVGIAGEDDLDAPDLTTPTDPTPRPETPKAQGNGQLKGTRHRSPLQGRRDATDDRQATPILATEASAQLRDRLLTEVHLLGSSDDAATWAHGNLADKNKLNAADAQAVENSFRAKLEALGGGVDASEAGERASAAASRAHPAQGKAKNGRRSRSIDKSVLAMPEPRRVRDRDHVRLVAQQPCLICGRQPADAHHLRFAQSRALSRKVSDEFTVPLCRGHHRELHRSGDEAAWWGNTGVDPTVAARALWLGSHPLRMDQEEPTLNQGVRFAPHLHTPSSP